ncbi:MAG: DUF1569 domain-containing protein [Bacteroidetes bacterium]|nr:DUF1569 domain-containing protein [Bacteroidota bacterium]
MKNIYNATDAAEFVSRINKLTPTIAPLWGKMDVGQMLAHCNVTYEMIYDNIHPKLGFFQGLILKAFVKGIVVNEKPYKKSSPTGPQFLIKVSKIFETEKKRLIDYIERTQKLGGDHFEGLESNSFGVLNKTEWNNMMCKHLDHHLSQFGV